MLNGKSTFVSLLFISLFFYLNPVYSKPKIDIDDYFKNMNLVKLSGSDTVLNLQAQLSNPYASTSKLSDFDDFIIITNIDYEANAIRFDAYETINDIKHYGSPWLGVAAFNQTEIPNTSFQKGLELVQSCMANKDDPTPSEITRFVIYKTLNTSEVVYDYIFKDPDYPAGICREVLYTPASQDCERGMVVNCNNDLSRTMLNKKFHGKI